MGEVQTLVKDYWNEAACGTGRTEREKFSREYFEEIEEFRYRHEPFIHRFAQFTRWNGKKVLEVGVGAGTDFLQWVRAGASAHGVDLTEEALDNVRHRLEVFGLEAAEVRVCDAEDLPYDDGAFDLVYSWGVIHHSEHMERVFGEIYRTTRPGGTVKIMVYNLRAVHVWYLYMRHVLLKGRLTKGRRWAVYHHQESIGTKAYTSAEIRR